MSLSFSDKVYAIVRQVPPGCVITYGAIARVLGDAHAARQVGWAMAATPAASPPIPSHRVVNARGDIPGGHASRRYREHRTQLEAEGVVFLPDGRLDLERYLWLPEC
ncbi:MAG: MGMT family protein [Chloroflexi bacterium]|nr:MGMT family protein [Chloroflexota bacterium]